MKGKMLFEMAFRKYPRFLDILLARNELYNQTLEYCEKMEREGRLFILAPSPGYQVGRTEKSLERREALYEHGYKLMEQEFNNMNQFLEFDQGKRIKKYNSINHLNINDKVCFHHLKIAYLPDNQIDNNDSRK
jgi:hypothetical protein